MKKKKKKKTNGVDQRDDVGDVFDGFLEAKGGKVLLLIRDDRKRTDSKTHTVCPHRLWLFEVVRHERLLCILENLSNVPTTIDVRHSPNREEEKKR